MINALSFSKKKALYFILVSHCNRIYNATCKQRVIVVTQLASKVYHTTTIINTATPRHQPSRKYLPDNTRLVERSWLFYKGWVNFTLFTLFLIPLKHHPNNPHHFERQSLMKFMFQYYHQFASLKIATLSLDIYALVSIKFNFAWI